MSSRRRPSNRVAPSLNITAINGDSDGSGADFSAPNHASTMEDLSSLPGIPSPPQHAASSSSAAVASSSSPSSSLPGVPFLPTPVSRALGDPDFGSPVRAASGASTTTAATTPAAEVKQASEEDENRVATWSKLRHLVSARDLAEPGSLIKNRAIWRIRGYATLWSKKAKDGSNEDEGEGEGDLDAADGHQAKKDEPTGKISVTRHPNRKAGMLLGTWGAGDNERFRRSRSLKDPVAELAELAEAQERKAAAERAKSAAEGGLGDNHRGGRKMSLMGMFGIRSSKSGGDGDNSPNISSSGGGGGGGSPNRAARGVSGGGAGGAGGSRRSGRGGAWSTQGSAGTDGANNNGGTGGGGGGGDDEYSSSSVGGSFLFHKVQKDELLGSEAAISQLLSEALLVTKKRREAGLIFMPGSPFVKVWQNCIVVVVVVFATLLFFPFAVGFVHCFDRDTLVRWDAFFFSCDALLLLDVFAVRLRTAEYVEDDSHVGAGTVLRISESRMHYLRSRWFPLDLLGGVPLEIIVYLVGLGGVGTGSGAGYSSSFSSSSSSYDPWQDTRLFRVAGLVRLPRYLCRLARLREFNQGVVARMQRESNRGYHVIRLLLMFLIIAVLMHAVACLWMVVNEEQKALLIATGKYHGITWNSERHRHRANEEFLADWTFQYVACLYAATLLIIGEDVGPVTETEEVFATIVMIFGTVVMGIIFRLIGDLISVFFPQGFGDKMDTVNSHMEALKLPHELRDRIRDFYFHVWLRDRSFDGLDCLEHELSPGLVTELKLHTYRPVIFNVPFLRDLDPNVVEAIVLRLTTQVLLQGDYAPHDDGLYLVLNGILEERIDVVRRNKTAADKTATKKMLLDSGSVESKEGKSGGGSEANKEARGRPRFAESVDTAAASSPASDTGTGTGSGTGGEKKNYVLRILNRGDHFGEQALLQGGIRLSQVRAISVTDLSRLSRFAYDDIWNELPIYKRQTRQVILHHAKGQLERQASAANVDFSCLRNTLKSPALTPKNAGRSAAPPGAAGPKPSGRRSSDGRQNDDATPEIIPPTQRFFPPTPHARAQQRWATRGGRSLSQSRSEAPDGRGEKAVSARWLMQVTEQIRGIEERVVEEARRQEERLGRLEALLEARLPPQH